MSNSTFGKIFSVTTWGESHGYAVGAVIDGCPSGILLNEEIIYSYLLKRKTKSYLSGTQRTEEDYPIIMSGVYNGLTTGTPISVMIKNKQHISNDYDNIKNIFRPSHADITYYHKYENTNLIGGGRSSGRETVGRVIGGAVAGCFLDTLNIKTTSFVKSIGNITANKIDFNALNNEFFFPDISKIEEIKNYMKNIIKSGNSVGSSVTTIIKNLPIGIGEPIFRKLDAMIANAVMSIGGVKAIEVGIGKRAAQMYGNDYNDAIYYEHKKIKYKSNNSGGILGGISNGNDIIINTYFKPTPSIKTEQKSIDKFCNNVNFNIIGRHDPVLAVRGNIVVQSMINIVLADLLLENCTKNINKIKEFYNE